MARHTRMACVDTLLAEAEQKQTAPCLPSMRGNASSRARSQRMARRSPLRKKAKKMGTISGSAWRSAPQRYAKCEKRWSSWNGNAG